MTEEIARLNGIDICFETFGDRAGRPLLLIMGLKAQMIWWPDVLCGQLAAAGFFVIRFDNRDSGRSQAMTGPPRLLRTVLRWGRPQYTLDDMGADALALLDHLGIGAAHVVGASMGGMIAQTIAIRHPERVLSLTSIMSTTGSRRVGYPADPRLLRFVLQRFPAERDAHVALGMALTRILTSPGFPKDETGWQDLLERSADRGVSIQGPKRQLAAIMSTPDRTMGLRSLRVPALVVHGTADPLVHVSGGAATARAIAGAELMLIPGMGHDLPREVWPQVIEAIVRTADRAERTA